MNNRQLFRIGSFVLALALGYFTTTHFGKDNQSKQAIQTTQPNQGLVVNTTNDSISSTIATENFADNSEVEGKGTVVKILPDDDKAGGDNGSRHQRFILRLDSGQTVLVAHNTDLAPRIELLNEDDTVVFKGVYVSNDKGGVIHWTHRDPQGQHEDGWLKRNGKIYQ